MDWKQWKACANEELPSGLWEIAFDYGRQEWAFKDAMMELELKAFKVLTPSFFCEQPSSVDLHQSQILIPELFQEMTGCHYPLLSRL